MLDAFAAVAATVSYRPPQCRVIGNRDGQLAGEELLAADYWVAQIRRPVCFAAGMTTLWDSGARTFLELGPQATLLGLGRACVTATDEPAQWLASLHPKRDDRQTMRDSLAALHVQGAAIDWRAVTAESGGRKIALPHYPFERQRYWVQATSPGRNGRAVSGGGHPLLGVTWESAAAPDWRQYEATLAPVRQPTWPSTACSVRPCCRAWPTWRWPWRPPASSRPRGA